MEKKANQGVSDFIRPCLVGFCVCEVVDLYLLSKKQKDSWPSVQMPIGSLCMPRSISFQAQSQKKRTMTNDRIGVEWGLRIRLWPLSYNHYCMLTEIDTSGKMGI